MNAAIKTRLDAIDEQIAELQKEQAKLREELDKPDFVPGWYLSWDGTSPTDKARGLSLDYIENPAELDFYVRNWGSSSPFTPELAARFFPKTRYGWAKIVKDYPEAKWATTDENGRVDVWQKEPNMYKGSWGHGQALYCLSCGDGYCRIGPAPDWRDSLEARPEWI